MAILTLADTERHKALYLNTKHLHLHQKKNEWNRTATCSCFFLERYSFALFVETMDSADICTGGICGPTRPSLDCTLLKVELFTAGCGTRNVFIPLVVMNDLNLLSSVVVCLGAHLHKKHVIA